jgi:hypothetical protein
LDYLRKDYARKISRRQSGAVAHLGLALGLTLTLGVLALAGCSTDSIPVLRSRAADAPTTVAATSADGSDSNAAECEQLRAQIRSNQQAVREAPTTSTMPIIVAAAEGRADNHIDEARQRMDELDCPSEDTSAGKMRPLAPLPPAPGAPSP